MWDKLWQGKGKSRGLPYRKLNIGINLYFFGRMHKTADFSDCALAILMKVKLIQIHSFSFFLLITLVHTSVVCWLWQIRKQWSNMINVKTTYRLIVFADSDRWGENEIRFQCTQFANTLTNSSGKHFTHFRHTAAKDRYTNTLVMRQICIRKLGWVHCDLANECSTFWCSWDVTLLLYESFFASFHSVAVLWWVSVLLPNISCRRFSLLTFVAHPLLFSVVITVFFSYFVTVYFSQYSFIRTCFLAVVVLIRSNLWMCVHLCCLAQHVAVHEQLIIYVQFIYCTYTSSAAWMCTARFSSVFY